MTTLAIIAGMGVLAYGALWVLSKVPMRHKNLTPERITSLLRALSKRGVEGASLIVKVRGDSRFVQFKHYITPQGKHGIRSDFPRAAWSRSHYDAVAEVVKQSRWRFERTPTDGEISEFLTVDFRDNLGAATTFATTVVTQVFGVSLERDCIAVLQGVRD